MQTFSEFRPSSGLPLSLFRDGEYKLITMNYQKIYDDLIKRAKQENRKKVKGGVYYENHHIIPKCLGGDNSKCNKVLLTGREHFIAHKLLVRIYPNNDSLWYSIWSMSVGDVESRGYKISSREYEKFRAILSIKISKLNKGVIRSDEFKAKVSKANLGKKMSDEAKELLRIANTGRVASAEVRAKLSLAQRGSKNAMYGRKHTHETRLNISERIRNSEGWEDRSFDNFKGHSHSEESKSKIRESVKKAFEDPDVRSKCSLKGEKNGFYGRKHSEETLEKLKKPKSEDHKKKISETIRMKNLLKGKSND